MNLERVYQSIILRAQSQLRVKYVDIYYEQHHILPVCLGGGNNSENLVLLTAREHFICHKLLVEIHSGNHKLIHALWMMTFMKIKQRDYKVSSREYERIKMNHAQIVSEKMKSRVVSDITRERSRISHTGKKQSVETIKRRSISNTGRVQSELTLEKRSKTLKGRVIDENWRKKISDAKVGKSPWNKGLKMSDEQIEKNRLGHLGKKQSQETIDKRRNTRIYKNFP